MKRFSVIIIVLLVGLMAWADAPAGYALLGSVPTGYVDYTGTLEGCNNVSINSQIIQSSSAYANVGSTIQIDGIAGTLTDQNINQHSTSYALRFSTDKVMTLTKNMAIHIVMRRRTNSGTNRVQISFCRTKWGDARLGYEIAGDQITSEYKEFILNVSNRLATNYNVHNAAGFIGEQTYHGGTWSTESRDLFRISAAADESFEIAQIYIEADDTQFPIFDAPTPISGEGYVLYGCKNIPQSYTDLNNYVAYTDQGNLTLDDSRFLAIKGTGSLPTRICSGSDYLQMSLKAAQTLSLDQDLFTLHIVVAKKRGTTGDLQVAFCKNGWNSARLGYTIANSRIGTTPTDIALTFVDRKTDSYNSHNENVFWGINVNYEAEEFLRICAAANQEFMITGVYIEKPAVTRYYFFRDGLLPDYRDGERAMDLRPGTGTALDGGNNTGISDDKKTFTRDNAGWWSFNQKFSKAVDMQNVDYKSWYMVIKFKTTCTSSDLNFRLLGQVAWTKPNDFSDINTDGGWNILKLPLSDADNKPEFSLSNTGNTKTVFQVHSESSTIGQYFTIDYMYLTNDPDLSENPACDNCFQVVF